MHKAVRSQDSGGRCVRDHRRRYDGGLQVDCGDLVAIYSEMFRIYWTVYLGSFLL